MVNLDTIQSFLLPDYAGGSIASVGPTVARLLDVPFEGVPVMPSTHWAAMGDKMRRVVVILLDSFGHNLLTSERAHLPGLARAAVDRSLTSVFPSTTVNCLSSVVTGRTPAAHGLVGLRLFFPEYAVLGQMLSMGPEFERMPDALVRAGVDLETFLQVPTVAEQLAAHGVKSYAWKGYQIVDSALSRIQGRGLAGNYGVVTFADMLVQMRRMLEADRDEKAFLYGYWPTIDTLSHVYGPLSAPVRAEARALFQQLNDILLEGLSAAAWRDTAIFVVADHGQVATPREHAVDVDNLPALDDYLLMRSAGEPRVPYFYARHGKVEALIAYLEAALGDAGVVLAADDALAAGLFGPDTPSRTTRDRLGDVVLAMRDGALFVNPSDREVVFERFVSWHGSLHQDEMRVPWIGWRAG